MKCQDCKNDSEKITGYFFDDGGGWEIEGDFICIECMNKYYHSPFKLLK